MTKRSHKNTSRLTAWERAGNVTLELLDAGAVLPDSSRSIVERALQAHARETLDRAKRRIDNPNRAPCTPKGATRSVCTCHRYVKGRWVSTERRAK